MFQRGAASRCDSAPALVYTPDISTVGVAARVLRRSRSRGSRAARRRASSSDSWTALEQRDRRRRSRASSQGRRRRSGAHRAGGARSGPRRHATGAADQTTSAGRPPARRRRDRRRAAPSPPAAAVGCRHADDQTSSSPAISTCSGATPQLAHDPPRPSRDSSVSPISTCLASLRHPRVGQAGIGRGAACDLHGTSVSPSIPAVASVCTAASSSATVPSGGRPSRAWDQIDRAAVQSLGHDPSDDPRAANRSTVSCAARDRAASSSELAVRR